ncbi:MAG TPA: hypothetical protein VK990_08795 [Acidimicrobiia bacterium]|nr:hypothetical protein [Acidimicrobiia bacterium]
MISSQQLRELVESSPEQILVDATGASLPLDGVPEDANAPALLVTAVTEAVKEVDGETIVRSLNRDAIWAVRGFLLSNDVVSALPDQIDSAAGLIEAVSRAGFRWSAVTPTPPTEPE